MTSETRVEFTKLIVKELAAFAFVFVLSFVFTYLILGLLYLFASNAVFIGDKPIISKAFEAWFYTTVLFISFPIIYFWRFPH